MNELKITSPFFQDNGAMQKKHTGFGEDVSPELRISGLDGRAKTLAVTMDDLDIPVMPEYSHWVIWNLPPAETIPEGIPHGESVPSLGGAVQGVGYGKNMYRGPKQPVFVRNLHRYRFTVYALDCALDLSATAKKPELMRAMEGHILQSGTITGEYKREWANK